MLFSKSARIGVLVGAAVAVAAMSPASAAGKKSNVDQTATETNPGALAVEELSLAYRLVALGDRTHDALAMIVAARIMKRHPVKTQKRTKTTEGPPATKGLAGPENAVSTADAALAKAREYAKGRKDVLAMIDDVAAATSRGRVGGPIRHLDRVRPRITDVFTITFRGRRRAAVAISGAGNTNLDLLVYDENGNLVCASTSGRDREGCAWTPKWTGKFRIKVRNYGYRHNRYWLLTN